MRWLVVLVAFVSISLSGCDLNPQPEVPSDNEERGTGGSASSGADDPSAGAQASPGPAAPIGEENGKEAEPDPGNEHADDNGGTVPPGASPVADAGDGRDAGTGEDDAGRSTEPPDATAGGVLN